MQDEEKTREELISELKALRGRVTQLEMLEAEQKRMEEILKQNAEWLMAVFEASRDGIVVEENENIVFANSAYAHLYGYDEPEKLVGKHVSIVQSPEDNERMLKFGRRRLQGETAPAVYEFKGIRKDGVIIDLEASVSASTIANKAYIITIIRDIAERKEAAEALRESEERYRILAETASDVIINIDEESRILFINQAAERVFGYSTSELIGQKITMLMPEYLRRVHQDAMKKYLETGQRHTSWTGLELAGLHKSGKEIFIEISFGEFIKSGRHYFGGIVRDVTERKMAEEKIHEQAALLDITKDAILVRDMEHRILFWNKCAEQMYGWSAEEAINKDADKLLFKDSPKNLSEAHKSVVENGQWNGELEQVTKFGKDLIVESRWSLVLNNEGKPRSILVVNIDITEKKQLEAQLLRAQRMESIGTLAGGIAHDLNNVLAPVLMALTLLRKKLSDKQDQQLLTTLETTVQRGAYLIKQILYFARGVEGEYTVIEVKHLISDVEKFIKETFPRSIKISVRMAEDLWSVSGNTTQLNQVLMNLCVNARDAMPEGGILSISADNILLDKNYTRLNIEAEVGPHIVITVSDTGTGIAPEILNRIFDPFFTTKEFGKGTGLGLSTSIGIIKSHKGFVQVGSELNRGATFKVFLPAL